MTTKPKPDDFDAAFAQASKEDDAAAAAAAEDAQGTDGGDEDDDDAAAAAAEDADDDASGGDDGADDDDGADGDAAADGKSGKAGGDDDATGDDGAGDDGADDGEGGTPPTKAKAAGQDDAQLTNEQLLARMSELLGKGSAEQHQQKDPPAKADAGDKGDEGKKEEQQQQPLYTEEEQQLIDAYRNDWPDIARAEALSRRQEYQQLIQFVFSQVKQVLDPISETVEVMSNQAHLQQLQTQITDYNDIRDKVVAWVEEQPAYLRAAYEHVITEGTAEEVADLVERYRRENGIEAPKAKASSDKQQQQSQDTELPAATKKAAAGLAPVRSKRSTPSGAADPADFDAAFAAFAKKI